MNLTLFTNKLITEYPVLLQPSSGDAKSAAVLVIFFNKHNKLHLLLIKRSDRLNLHAGEISFPGGKFEVSDETLMNTALRETLEEINLAVESQKVLAQLPQVKTRTGFLVSPFICYLEQLTPLKSNPREVSEILEAPLIPLLATHHRDVGHQSSKDMVAYWYKHHRIWGATAKIIHQIGKITSLI